MEKRTLEAIEAELNNAVNQRTKAAADLNNHIAIARAAASKAMGHLSAAQEAGEPKEYAIAADEHRAAQDVLNMYTDKLTALESEPPLNYTEYKETKKKILDHLEKVTEKNRLELMDVMKRMEAIRDDMNIELNQGNGLLQRLQREIMQVSRSTNYIDDEFKKLDILFYINESLSRGAYLKEVK